VIAGAPDAPTYLRAEGGVSRLALQRWRLEDWFVKGGVGVSVYRPLELKAAE
jgi:hypothetical protein